MNTLLIGYDLNKAGQDYKDLIEHLKATGTWWHSLDSTWLVKTSKSAKEYRDELVADNLIDSNDEVLVINVTGDAAAWYGFNDESSQWLIDNL